MTALIGEYRDNDGRKHTQLTFDPPISLEKGCTKQERNAIDEFNKVMAEIERKANVEKENY